VMPRSKGEPSRKRPLSDEAAVLAAMPDLVEQVEIAAWQAKIDSGEAEELDMGAPQLRGIARIDVAPQHLQSLAQLHAHILEKIDGKWSAWGGVGDTSGRRRGYGYLPGRELAASHYSTGVVAMREYSGAKAEADANANKRASVMLAAADLPQGVECALEDVMRHLAPAVPSEHMAFLKPQLLVAAQPNLHRGHAYLRPHLDEPLHDGFGVVIVTIAIRGDARILLSSRPWDAERRQDYWFELRQGQAYVLASDARNLCLHGVLAESTTRESLNLRFGLHATSPNAPFSAWDEVEKHWPRDAVGNGAGGRGEPRASE